MCTCYKHYISESLNSRATCGGQTITKISGGYNVRTIFDIFVPTADMTVDIQKATTEKTSLQSFDPTSQISAIDGFKSIVQSLN